MSFLMLGTYSWCGFRWISVRAWLTVDLVCFEFTSTLMGFAHSTFSSVTDSSQVWNVVPWTTVLIFYLINKAAVPEQMHVIFPSGKGSVLYTHLRLKMHIYCLCINYVYIH